MDFDRDSIPAGRMAPTNRELADLGRKLMVFDKPYEPTKKQLHPVVLKYSGKVEILYDYLNPCGIPEEDFSLPLYAWPNSSGGYDIMIRKKEGEKDKYEKMCEAPDERSAKTELERYIDSQGKFRELIKI